MHMDKSMVIVGMEVEVGIKRIYGDGKNKFKLLKKKTWVKKSYLIKE